MLFNSVSFMIFLPVVTLIYFLIPRKYQYIWLLVVSYYFYMCWNAGYAILLLLSTLITYVCGIVLQHIRQHTADAAVRKKKMNVCVAVSFILNLGILFYFKYFNFLVENLNLLFARIHVSITIPAVDVLLPVGISFFTFQALGYTMDVRRGETDAEKNFLRYALFVSFFPQLVAGPIERSENLLGQLQEGHRFEYEKFRDGIYLMLWGYFLKLVVADRAAIFVDRVYGNMTEFPGVYLIVASMLFAFQIYCDFAGYSTIAMGTAKMMGFHLMDNFNAPYFSRSVAEFWKRWHISLSSWFRDYLYIPLGGNRRGTYRTYLNLLLVFAVSGLWHGASWNFIVWGVINAVYQIAGSLLRKPREKLRGLLAVQTERFAYKGVQTLATFVLIDLSWIFFRADSLGEARQAFKSMITCHNPWVLFDESLQSTVLTRKNFNVLLMGIGLILISDYFKYKGICVRDLIKKQDFWFRSVLVVCSVVCILVFGIWGPQYDAASFIYFQF